MAEACTSGNDESSAVIVEGLEMHYALGRRSIRALRGVDLTVPRGEFLVIRGRSGSGKSSLLHALAGLQLPSAGRIRVSGENVHLLRPRESALLRRRRIGVVFQFFNLLPMLTVAQNVAFPLALDRVDARRAEYRTNAVLEPLGLLERSRDYPDQLSGGEMQRVAIARALVITPALILADEPTGSVDSRTAGEIWSLLHDLARRHGLTTIVVSHEAEAENWADRVVTLEDGVLVADSAASRTGDSRQA